MWRQYLREEISLSGQPPFLLGMSVHRKKMRAHPLLGIRSGKATKAAENCHCSTGYITWATIIEAQGHYCSRGMCRTSPQNWQETPLLLVAYL